MPVIDRIRPRRGAAVVLAGLVTLASLAGCGGGGSKKSQFTAKLRQLGLPSQVASCVSDHLYSSLTSSEVAQFFSAAQKSGANPAAISLPLRRKLYAAVAPCAPSSAPASKPG